MRVYNFSAGPAVLPEEVLREAADEMLDYKGTGMSVMEMSHRSKAYDAIIKEAEKDIREIMNIPDNYKVLFLQGGASQQFAAVPMNLMKNKKAAYIITGQWAKKAYQEAKIYGDAVAVASSADKTFSYIPDCSDLDIPEDADYVYICENNTIYGTEYQYDPETPAGVPLVADMSSNILSKPVDVSKYGVIYAGAQKNMGPAGVTVVIVREDLLGSYPLNESVAITRARDKLRSLQLLARQGIDLPVTGIAHSPDDTSDLIDMVGGAPLVIKLVEGTQGIGVVLAETRQAAESVRPYCVDLSSGVETDRLKDREKMLEAVRVIREL